MGFVYTVRAGDCISSIAFRYGFHPDTIWDDPNNKALRDLRQDPNVLMAGDRVFVPDLRVKEVSAAAGRSHHFKRKAVPDVFQVRMLDRAGKPRAGLTYHFIIDGVTREGTTDGNGGLREWIPPDAVRGELVIFDGRAEEHYDVALGHLDPVTEVSGIQSRLETLGYPAGGDPEQLAAALRRFQRDHDLPVTGLVDDETQAAIRKAYGG